MKEFSANHPNGIDRGSRTAHAEGIIDMVRRGTDQTIVTQISPRFGGGWHKGSNRGFNGPLNSNSPQAEKNTNNSS